MKAFLEALTPGEADWAIAQSLEGRWAGRRSLRSTVESCARLVERRPRAEVEPLLRMPRWQIPDFQERDRRFGGLNPSAEPRLVEAPGVS